jgi:hypothetical protein
MASGRRCREKVINRISPHSMLCSIAIIAQHFWRVTSFFFGLLGLLSTTALAMNAVSRGATFGPGFITEFRLETGLLWRSEGEGEAEWSSDCGVGLGRVSWGVRLWVRTWGGSE